MRVVPLNRHRKGHQRLLRKIIVLMLEGMWG
jgi:hypothetical protein